MTSGESLSLSEPQFHHQLESALDGPPGALALTLSGRDEQYWSQDHLRVFQNYPILKESLGENEYMHMYEWISLLSTWNYPNIVNQLYSNIK